MTDFPGKREILKRLRLIKLALSKGKAFITVSFFSPCVDINAKKNRALSGVCSSMDRGFSKIDIFIDDDTRERE